MTEKKKFRNICFTIFNYIDDTIEQLKKLYTDNICNYIIFGKEICPTTNRPHLQCYAELTSQMRLGALKRIIPNNAHIIACDGSGIQNKIYCSKDDQYIELGIMKKPGKRNDIKILKERVMNNENIVDIFDSCKNYNDIRIVEKFIQYKSVSKVRKRLEIIYITGPSGSGKTEYAYKLLSDDFWRNSPMGLNWFDGYVGQTDVLLNEFRADFCKLHTLLELLDGYEIKVPIKGGFTHWNPSRIIITSIFKPTELYNYNHIDNINQFLRRLTKVITMNKFKVVSEVGGNTNPNLLIEKEYYN